MKQIDSERRLKIANILYGLERHGEFVPFAITYEIPPLYHDLVMNLCGKREALQYLCTLLQAEIGESHDPTHLT